jgi:sugar phosphate permease
VRHGLEQFWRVFFDNVYHADTRSLPFQFVANIGFVSGVVGSMTAGVVSDRYFGSRRGPVAAIWYTGQFLLLGFFALIVPAVAVVERQRSMRCGGAGGTSGGTLLVVMLSLTAALVVANFIAANTRGGRKLAFYAAQIAAIVAVGVVWSRLSPADHSGALALFARTAPAAGAAAAIALLQFLIGGAHGLLAGTASMDYGGRKAAATAAGFFDGVQYLAGSLVSLLLAYTLHLQGGWRWWIPSIAPFALVGAGLMAALWQAMPAGAKKSGH